MKIQPDNQTLLLAGAPAQRAHAPGSVFAVLSSNRLNISAEPSIDEAELLVAPSSLSPTYAKPVPGPVLSANETDGAASEPQTPGAFLPKKNPTSGPRMALNLYASTQSLSGLLTKTFQVDTYA